MKVRLLIVAVTALLSSLALAQADNRNVVGLDFGFGDADYVIDGTAYDGDIDATSLSSTIYVSDRLFFSFSRMGGEATIAGVNLETSGTSYGIGYTLGEVVDLAAGFGSEINIGVEKTDAEVTAAGVTFDSDWTSVGISFNRGLGDGLTFGLDFSTDTDSLFDDNTFGASLFKHIGSNIMVGGRYGGGKTEEDVNNSSKTSSFSFGVGYAF